MLIDFQIVRVFQHLTGWRHQFFLNDHIYDKIVGDTMIHAKYNKYEKWAKNFPETNYNGFVGETVHANDRPSLINRLRMLAYRMKYSLKNKLLS